MSSGGACRQDTSVVTRVWAFMGGGGLWTPSILQSVKVLLSVAPSDAWDIRGRSPCVFECAGGKEMSIW